MLKLEGYSLIQKLRKNGEFIVLRGQRSGDQKPVLIVQPAAEHPTTAILLRLQHEYNLRNELDPSWAAQPLDLINTDGKTSLILDDAGGQSLDQLLGRAIELPLFLRIAVGICASLGRLHQQDIIHKDIKPANILIDAASGNCRITGFGIASRVPREQQAPLPMEVIAGTFAYMAPEQTGRMNRSIDSRSDLYALGVTFYEMLTGSLPFTASDPMGWVHCHIARQPTPPSRLRPDIPEMLSAIIMKLLAKTAEMRYQTAAGVMADLSRCMEQWSEKSFIAPFVLGTRDASRRLMIPETLYGREVQKKVLLDAAARVVVNTNPELVLVSGYSGIGKSSLVNELHKSIIQPRAVFVSGKFDQYKRDIPYATLAQALQSLIRQLLSQSERELLIWRQAILKAVGNNGQLMVDLIPELRFVIGEQAATIELAPDEALNRFQTVFRQFLGTFAMAERPLIIFLDDLQWIDPASLKLLEHLMTHSEVRHVLFIGAYRDNEVTAAHPLMLTKDTIQKSKASVHEVVLAPLQEGDVARLVADTLRCDVKVTATLSQLVYEKTEGNPFFTIQFLTSLAEQRLLAFDAITANWTWDIDRIRARDLSDNVVDLMIGKLQRLPEATQDAFQYLACLGNTANVETVARMADKTEEETHTDLWHAVRMGLLIRNDNYYRFQHDRVQEAAYSLVSPQSLPQLHLQIGRLLLSTMSAEAIEEDVFSIVNHLNRGMELITDQQEKDRLCFLNLLAGRKAKDSIAYASARGYLIQAIALLPDDAWQYNYEDTFAIYFALSECEYLTAHYDQANQLFDLIFAHAGSSLDKAKLYILQLTLHQISGHFDSATEVSRQALSMFGVDFPKSDEDIPAAVQREKKLLDSSLNGRDIAELVNLPLIHDIETRVILELLTEMAPSVWNSSPKIYPLVILTTLNFVLRHGNTEAACFAYSSYAILSASIGEVSAAIKFSELALLLNDKFKDSKRKGRLLFNQGAIIHCWQRSIASGVPVLENAFVSCLETGNLLFANHAASAIALMVIEKNEPLDDALKSIKKYIAFTRQSHYDVVTEIVRLSEQFVACMKGLTNDESSLNDDGFSESEALVAITRAGYGSGIPRFHMLKQVTQYTFGHYEEALESAAQAAQHLHYVRLTLIEASHYFYHALTLAALYPGAGARQHEYKEQLLTRTAMLKKLAEDCPENFLNRYTLVLAEIARIEGRELDAMHAYDDAIKLSREHGFMQAEGIANELAAKFYLSQGFERVATNYLREARYCFLKWGALGKVNQLDSEYPWLDAQAVPASAMAYDARLENLDMMSVVKASQAVSGVIELEQLIKSLLQIVIENAGAERGLLMLPHEQGYRIEAEANTLANGAEVNFLRAPTTTQLAPETVFQYVIRTQEKVLLDDACLTNQFSGDAYLFESQPRSVLCLPLLKQGKMAGVLYLENKLTPGVFTPERIAVLELLASQAAISLENASLYHNLKEENNDRKRAELALQQHQDQLEQTIRERTAEVVRQNLELERAYKALEDVSLTDQLTGLRNRRFLQQQLDVDIAITARRYEEWLNNGSELQPEDMDLIFYMVDLDHFKAVNDQYGHAAGDRVLVQIRERLEEVFRESDFLTRWGGEEFLVVARSTSRSDAATIAERIRHAISGREFELADDAKLARTCSVGFACYPFLPATPRLLSWSQVVELADQALYAAKRSGRNAWVGYFGTEQTRIDNAFQRLMHKASLASQDEELQMVSSKDVALLKQW
ncbi:diguanylate cyclase [Undibacterium sp. TJN25]|uniref:diguanylate cyclase n=1 Tax=Undibacterium sp. TJN25 TaxID=3413056 RepID=UPI003BF45C35